MNQFRRLGISVIARGAFAAALFFLTACASTVPTLEFRRSVYQVKTIAILTPAVPEKPTLYSAVGVTPLAVFGVAGALVDEKIQDYLASKFLEEMNSRTFSVGSVLERALITSLRNEGYDIVEANCARNEAEFLHDYPSSSNGVNYAYLDLVVTDYGYHAGSITAPYHPILKIKYRLVRASDKAILMQGSFGYSIFGSDIQPDTAYDFSNHDQILSNPSHAIEGLNAGVSIASGAIAGALK